jgi:voltage-gated potassium channel
LSHLLPAFVLMTVAVAVHLFGGLVLVMHLRQQVDGKARNRLLHVFRLVVELFAVLLLLHLIQVGLWALLYWWQIGWDLNTALYFSTTTYATIGYGDVVPPPEWRLVAVMEGLTGVLMLGWSSAMVFAVVARLINPPG